MSFISKFKEIKKKYQITVQLFLTEKCNFNCSFCFRNSYNIKVKDMSLEIAKEIILRYAGTNVKISFTGGEPVLNPHLEDMLKFCAIVGIDSELYTNGKQNFNQYSTHVRLGYDGFFKGCKPMMTKKFSGRYELGVMVSRDNVSDLLECINATKNDPGFLGIIQIVDIVGMDKLPLGGVENYKRAISEISEYIAENCPWVDRVEISVGKLGIQTDALQCRYKRYQGDNNLVEVCPYGRDPRKCDGCLLQSQVFIRTCL
jgi:hypothetical protein